MLKMAAAGAGGRQGIPCLAPKRGEERRCEFFAFDDGVASHTTIEHQRAIEKQTCRPSKPSGISHFYCLSDAMYGRER
jgi:hypothetical protein